MACLVFLINQTLGSVRIRVRHFYCLHRLGIRVDTPGSQGRVVDMTCLVTFGQLERAFNGWRGQPAILQLELAVLFKLRLFRCTDVSAQVSVGTGG